MLRDNEPRKVRCAYESVAHAVAGERKRHLGDKVVTVCNADRGAAVRAGLVGHDDGFAAAARELGKHVARACGPSQVNVVG